MHPGVVVVERVSVSVVLYYVTQVWSVIRYRKGAERPRFMVRVFYGPLCKYGMGRCELEVMSCCSCLLHAPGNEHCGPWCADPWKRLAHCGPILPDFCRKIRVVLVLQMVLVKLTLCDAGQSFSKCRHLILLSNGCPQKNTIGAADLRGNAAFSLLLICLKSFQSGLVIRAS